VELNVKNPPPFPGKNWERSKPGILFDWRKAVVVKLVGPTGLVCDEILTGLVKVKIAS
jgi:hypothetical protein